MELTVLANVASAVAVVVAVVFGFLQLSHLSKTRAIFSSTELVSSIQTAEFTRSVRLVMNLPEGAAPDLISRDPAMVDAALTLGHVFESLGVLVYHRVLSLHIVDDLVGGYLRGTWTRLHPYIESRRRDLGVHYGEWMQWLVERLDEHPSPGKAEGAHRSHRAWKP